LKRWPERFSQFLRASRPHLSNAFRIYRFIQTKRQRYAAFFAVVTGQNHSCYDTKDEGSQKEQQQPHQKTLLVAEGFLMETEIYSIPALSANLLEEIVHPDVRKYSATNFGLLFRIGSAFRVPNAEEIDIASHV
jgi:hypothetical protein